MDNTIVIGLIREGKVPADKRVPLTPKQCALVQSKFPNVKVKVQQSRVRAFADDTYREAGIEIVEELTDCDIILGVKEVNVEDLIPNKHFLFFSHTIKKQPYNRKLLRAVLENKIQLTDYEVIKDKNNKRLIGFGRYAGIVGAYNGILTFGEKHNLYHLKRANACADRAEMEQELKNVNFPSHTKIVLTGFGRVGNGAREIMDLLPITEVSPEEFLTGKFDGPVFTHLEVGDYFERIDGKPFEKADFYASPELYQSCFSKFSKVANMYIACHFWSSKSPLIITHEDFASPENTISVVADISCDIAGPIACTLRPSVIASPFYGYDPKSKSEVDLRNLGAIAVMAVDNLPCELPLDASEDFGNELIKHVLPALVGEDVDKIIERGTETNKTGQLTSYFAYLQDYVNGEPALK